MVAKVTDMSSLPDWPRKLSAQQAAVYVGLTEPTFLKLVKTGVYPEGQAVPETRRIVWDKKLIDRVEDARSGLAASAAPNYDDEEWEKWQP
ncbi:hypothetical protein [Nisaea sp.]|uniref:hypothetical protein n=1 Tax=Nisaea sp. TaxID=2024842 RepID=UPI003298CFFA